MGRHLDRQSRWVPDALLTTFLGTRKAFAHFGAVPQSIVYDNTKLAVAKILGDGGAAAHASIHRNDLALFIPGALRPSGQRQ